MRVNDALLDSAGQSYLAWGKAIEDGKFNTQAHVRTIEQEKLSQIACIQTPIPPTTIGAAPTPTATPPAISGKDVVQGLCDAADEVDPWMPNPETVGGPDAGDIIDQAYLWQQSVPVVSPQSELMFRVLVQGPIIVAKAFKDGASTAVNFACQQKDKSGPYYELFPIDQKVQAAKEWWNKMDTKQKAVVIGYTILALLIALPLVLALVG